jgi:O-antigen/teichoic acid export membrane protein
MRRKYSIFNISTGIVSQIVLALLGLISRKIFVDIMGLQLLGVSGLFSSIISFLSLAELGIGGAIYYSLYKPLAKNDHQETRQIMNLYSRLYKYVALAVFVIGMALLPFLKIFVKDNIPVFYLNTVYLIFLADAILSYLFAYRRSIISADQKSYIITSIQLAFSIALTALQILIIIVTQNFILYLVVKVLLGFSSNLLFHFLARRMYPYLKEKEVGRLSPGTKAEIIKNAKALFIVNIAVYFVYGTDNILLTYFGGITVVGLYSNYLLIINTINGLVGQVFGGIRASFGNFLVKKSKDDAHMVFDVLYFLNFWIVGLCSICLVVLLNPFIGLWLGKNALFPFPVVAIIVTNFYSRGMTSAIETVRNGAGLYSPYPLFKYRSLAEGILNLALGILLAGLFKMGIIGIFLATSISNQVTILGLPYDVYRYVFNKSSKQYYKKLIVYTMCTFALTTFVLWICSYAVLKNEFISLALKFLICITVPNVIITTIFCKTNEFKYIVNTAKQLIRKR